MDLKVTLMVMPFARFGFPVRDYRHGRSGNSSEHSYTKFLFLFSARMSDFNAGLRIEVENDLFREDGEEVVDDIEVDKDQTEGRHPSPASYAEDSDKEDGELSGPNSPRGGESWSI